MTVWKKSQTKFKKLLKQISGFIIGYSSYLLNGVTSKLSGIIPSIYISICSVSSIFEYFFKYLTSTSTFLYGQNTIEQWKYNAFVNAFSMRVLHKKNICPFNEEGKSSITHI